MVRINSVRQSVPAPQEPIMGGALQGFGAFANSRAKNNIMEEKRGYDQSQAEQKYVSNLLSTLAQKGIIAEGPGAPGWYKKLGLEQQPKEVDWTKKKAQVDATLKGMKGGLMEMDPKVQAEIDREKKEEVRLAVKKYLLFNSPKYASLMAKGDEVSLAKAAALEERHLAGQESRPITPIVDYKPEKLKGFGGHFMDALGDSAGSAINKAKSFFNKEEEPQEPQVGAIKSMTSPDGMKTEYHAPAQEAQETEKPKTVTQQRYPVGAEAVKDGVRYKRQKDGTWKPIGE